MLTNTEIKKLLSDVKSEFQGESSPCEYWDIRIEKVQKTEIIYQQYELTECSIKPSLGAFIRVFNDGMWFFCSTTDLRSIKNNISRLSKETLNMAGEENQIKICPYNKVSRSENYLVYEDSRMDKVSVTEKRSTLESYFSTLKEGPNFKKC